MPAVHHLTWTRSSDARGARWEEVDERVRLWSIPAERMRANKPHDVPLSHEACEIIAMMRKRILGTGLVFPGASGGVLSDVGLNKVLHHLPTVRGLDVEGARRAVSVNGRKPLGATVHGMRSTARSWAATQTEVAPFVAELALAHVNKDKVEAAYQRDRVLEKRRALLQAWGYYCSHARVVELGNARSA